MLSRRFKMSAGAGLVLAPAPPRPPIMKIDETCIYADDTVEENPSRFPGFDWKETDEFQQKIRLERKASDYKGRDGVQSHTYYSTDVYVGSMSSANRAEWIFDYNQNKLCPANIDCSEGFIRCFLEILSNAGDNADSSRRMGVNPGSIDISMDRHWVTIRNSGEPIPIVPKPEISTQSKCLTMLDWIFGKFFTSSHYDDTVIRMGCGKNGLGAKLCNTFSSYFVVKAGDPKNGQEHVSIWQGNMLHLTCSKTTPGFVLGQVMGADGRTPITAWVPAQGTPYRGPAYVEVSWKLDFKRFNCRVAHGGEYGYPDAIFGLFARYLIDFSLTCKIPVSFNKKSFDVRSIKDYAALFFPPEKCATAVTHYEWDNKENEPPEDIAKLRGSQRDKAIAQCATADHIPSTEVLVLDTPDSAICFSFVNGLMSTEGGVHVEEAYKKVTAEVLEKLNGMGTRSRGKNKGKSKEKDKEKKKDESKKPHLTPGDVKGHMSMIISCRLRNPVYKGQSKAFLTNPKPKLNIDEKITSSIGKWELIERLYAALQAKQFKTLTKSDGKNRRRIFLEKGEDANEAGGPRSNECILYGVEGLSASSYPKKRIVLDPRGGKDFSGYIPFRGKFLNVTNATIDNIASNEEVVLLKKYIGLCEGKDYNDPVERSKLRYGFFLSAVDADSDGKHINTLLINFFYKRFKSILQQGMFGYLMTPAVRVFRDRERKHVIHRFYSPEEYEVWEKQNPGHRYFVKYYKGLGTSRDADIRDDMDTAPTIICIFDDTAGNSLDLAFSRENSDARKLWIQRWRHATRIDDIVPVSLSSLLRRRPITSVINRDLIDYTVDSLFRAIPSFRDGFKRSQRQAMYYILHHWKYGRSNADSMKVMNIACAASEFTHYHHGPVSMADTIINMAQNFVGSNNLNLFRQDGQFGNRDMGGKDAADGRYCETCPAWWLEYVYSKELIELIPVRKVESNDAEPIWLPCDVPIHIINGSQGVATGHSTYIPPHNPYDVIRWLYERCAGKENPEPLKPWVNGFRGDIEIFYPKRSGVSASSALPPLPPPTAPLPLPLASNNSEEKKRSRFIQSAPIPTPTPTPTPPPQVGGGGGEEKKRSRFVSSTPSPPEEEDEEEDESIPNENVSTDDDDQSKGDDDEVTAATGARRKGISMRTMGVFEITRKHPSGKCDLLITELPVGRWLHPYKKWLETLREQKIITDVRDNSKLDMREGFTIEIPCYMVTGFEHPKGVTMQTLRLQKSYGLSNMTLIDDDGYPHHFPNTQRVMEKYYDSMLHIYTMVAAQRVADAEAKLVDKCYQHQLISLIALEEKIIVFKNGCVRSEEDVYGQMAPFNIPRKYYDSLKMRDCNRGEITSLASQIETLKAKILALRQVRPQHLWAEKLIAFDAELRRRKYGA